MFTTIPSATLKQLVKLSERKEALMAQIQEIDREMVRMQSRFGVPSRNPALRAPVTVSRPAARVARDKHIKRVKRGALKKRILQALHGAGNKGATVQELSRKLGVRPANLYVWFNGTGKNVAGLKKIGTAKYRLNR
jgi:hypothetical protein